MGRRRRNRSVRRWYRVLNRDSRVSNLHRTRATRDNNNISGWSRVEFGHLRWRFLYGKVCLTLKECGLKPPSGIPFSFFHFPSSWFVILFQHAREPAIASTRIWWFICVGDSIGDGDDRRYCFVWKSPPSRWRDYDRVLINNTFEIDGDRRFVFPMRFFFSPEYDCCTVTPRTWNRSKRHFFARLYEHVPPDR